LLTAAFGQETVAPEVQCGYLVGAGDEITGKVLSET
jgi:hypothetical protein